MSILDDVRNQRIKLEDFLDAQTEEVIQARMFERVSPDLDIAEGSYMWDAIVPTSFEHALAYIALRYAFLMAFPQYSTAEQLSLHAAAHGAPRRAAETATGEITVTGSPGTSIPAGTLFAVPVAVGSEDVPKYYATTEDAIIPIESIINIPIRATVTGTAGNVRAGEITLNIEKLRGIVSLTNNKALENGIDEEPDGILLPRMLDRVKNPPSSGNKSDYRRWALEVPGVGDAVVQALWAGPGTVRVILVGMDGEPVVDDILKAAQEYIDPDKLGEGEGKAPVGAQVTIATVIGLPITVSIPGLVLEAGYTLDEVRPLLEKSVKMYLAGVSPGAILRLKEIESVLIETEGVADFDTISVNGEQQNIQLGEEQKAVMEEVVIEDAP